MHLVSGLLATVAAVLVVGVGAAVIRVLLHWRQ
jgi:hypothetical protein